MNSNRNLPVVIKDPPITTKALLYLIRLVKQQRVIEKLKRDCGVTS